MATGKSSAALHALHAALGDDMVRAGYWSALSRFFRFEITKADFDDIALAALGPHLKLHNQFILALLSEAAGGAQQPDVSQSHAFVAHHLPIQSNATTAASSSTALDSLSAAPGAAVAAAAAASSASLQPPPPPPPQSQPPGLEAQASGSGPKIMLKIGLGGSGKIEASTQRPDLKVDLKVDAAEEAQLNALHERLRELAKSKGLQGVQPEAASFMQRAVRVVSNRLLVAASQGTSQGVSSSGGAAPKRQRLSANDLREAIRQPTMVPAPWMAPPCQKPGYQLGAIAKFGS